MNFKNTFLTLGAVLTLSSCQNTMDVSVSLDNWTAGDSVYARLVRVTETEIIALDSVFIKDGKAELTAELDQAQMLFVQIDGLQPPVMLYGWKESVEVTGDAAAMPFRGRANGSPLTDSLSAFMDHQETFQQQAGQMEQEYGRSMQSGDVATAEALMGRFQEMYEGNMAFMTRFAANNGPLGAFVANRYLFDEELSSLEKILESSEDSFQGAPDVIALKERIEKLKKVAIGQKLTDLTQADPAGQPVSLSSIRGKYILVDFWASWCRPCRAQNPELVALYKQYNSKGLEVIGVSFDETAEAWKGAIAEDGLTWKHMSDLRGWNNSAAELYSIRSIPQNIVLDGKGTIVLRNVSVKDLTAFLAKNLR